MAPGNRLLTRVASDSRLERTCPRCNPFSIQPLTISDSVMMLAPMPRLHSGTLPTTSANTRAMPVRSARACGVGGELVGKRRPPGDHVLVGSAIHQRHPEQLAPGYPSRLQ